LFSLCFAAFDNVKLTGIITNNLFLGALLTTMFYCVKTEELLVQFWQLLVQFWTRSSSG